MDDDQGADQQDEKAIIDRGARYELTLGPLGHEIWISTRRKAPLPWRCTR
jgi:hypothetical protein